MNIKIEHYKNLVAIAAADGYLNSREREYLSDKAQELGLDEKEVKEIIAEADTLQYIVPLNSEDGEDQLNEAIFMSIIDGDIAEQEYQLCLTLADRLGIEKKYLDETVDAVKLMWAR